MRETQVRFLGWEDPLEKAMAIHSSTLAWKIPWMEEPDRLQSNMLSFPGGSEVKASTCNVGDLGSIPGSGRSPGEGNGNPLQYSCLENPMDRGAWWATVHKESDTTEPLHFHFQAIHTCYLSSFSFFLCLS